jgi:multimeric flavodoxin WrbA
MASTAGRPLILGIAGSPRKNNTEAMLSTALDAAAERGVETRFVSLAGKRIEPCLGCYRCAEGGNDAYFCQRHKDKDDMHAIYASICEADALLIASPVYFGTVSGQIKVMMDRFMPFYGDFKHGGTLTGKLGAALAVGIKPHGGQELTIRTIHGFFLHLGMIIVGPAQPHLYCSYGGAGVEQSDKRRSVLTDERATGSSVDIGARIATLLLESPVLTPAEAGGPWGRPRGSTM